MANLIEISFRFHLKKETPQQITDILKYMIEQYEMPVALLDHKFFSMEKWDRILISFTDDTQPRDYVY